MPRSGHLDLFRPARHSICILYYFPYIHLTVAIDNAITSQVITGDNAIRCRGQLIF